MTKKELENLVKEAHRIGLPEDAQLLTSHDLRHFVFWSEAKRCHICLWPLKNMRVVQLEPGLKNGVLGTGWSMQQVIDHVARVLAEQE